MLWNMIKLILLFGVLTSLGCAPKNLASVSDQNAARRFETPANKSHIYVIRLSQGKGSGLSFSVKLDNIQVGSLESQTFTVLEVVPGDHNVKFWMPEVKLSPYAPLGTRLNCLPGKSYFLLVKHWNLNVIPEEEGKEYIMKYDMVKNSAAPVNI